MNAHTQPPLSTISIITPVYRGAKFLESCIQNVIQQNCPDVEHIIVDGGSQDGTREILERYSQDYPHLQWISEPDRGQSDAMNKGIQMAKGQVIGILNVDDSYEPNTLNQVVQLFKDLPTPSFLVGNCHVWNDDLTEVWLSKPDKLTPVNILAGRTHLVNPCAYFYHADLHHKIGEYKIDEHYVMDLDFVLRAAPIAHLKYVDMNFGNYRMYAETKTVQDTENGNSRQRRKNCLDSHFRELPIAQKIQVSTVRTLMAINYRIRVNQLVSQ